MQIWDEKITASGGRTVWLAADGSDAPSKEAANRRNALLHAQSLGAADVVGVARQIETYINGSDDHAEAFRIAVRGAHRLDVLSVMTLAESIRAYLSEPSPSVQPDPQRQPSASQSAA